MLIIGDSQNACHSRAPVSYYLLVIHKMLARVVHLYIMFIIGDLQSACQSSAPASCLLLVIYKMLARVVHLYHVYHW